MCYSESRVSISITLSLIDDYGWLQKIAHTVDPERGILKNSNLMANTGV